MNLSEYLTLKASECLKKGTAFPLSINLESTYRCNFQCVQCYNPKMKRIRGNKKEMSTEELVKLIAKLKKSSCLSIVVTGGEPLIRNDIYKILNSIFSSGILCVLFTNGSLIDGKFINFSKEHIFRKIIISVYGMSSRTYQTITGNGKYFNLVFGNILKLLKNKIEFTLSFITMKYNFHETEIFRKFCIENNIKYNFNYYIHSNFSRVGSAFSLRISPKDVAKLGQKERTKPGGYHLDPTRKGRQMQCNAGLTNFAITPFKELYPCAIFPYKFINLRETELLRACNILKKELDELKLKKYIPCIGCGLKDICKQCPGWSWLEHRNHYDISDFVCSIANQRAK